MIPTHSNEIWELLIDYDENIMIVGSASDKLTIKKIKDID